MLGHRVLSKFSWGLILALVVVVLAYSYNATQSRGSDYLSYSIVNSLEHVSLDELDDAMHPFLAQSFWEVDLLGLKQTLEQVSWIQSATIKRSWPGYLEVSIQEHQPIARWGDNGLISQEGKLFIPQSRAGFDHLIQLDGDRLQVPQLLAALAAFEKNLAQLGWQVVALSQQVDGVFRVESETGLSLVVDAPNWTHKLERFVKAYPQLSKKLVESAHSYDLRYSNGVAIKTSPNLIH